MLSYLRLIRFPNLLIIMLSQVLVRYCLILPAFKTEYFITEIFPNYLSNLNFYILVASTLTIAVGGYIINDYFDIHIDEINKPGKNIIEKNLSKKMAMSLYIVLSSIGILSGFYVAFRISKPELGLLQMFSVASLWMYSSFYKRRFLSGNLIISLLSALSLLIIGLFEPSFYKNFVFLTWFAIPAFLLSLIREIIKDIEDIDGDELSQCKTVPIVLGIAKTKKIILILIILLVAYITYILRINFYTNTVINFWYLISMFIIPISALAYLVNSANQKKDYFYASLFSKILMLGGIFSMFLFWNYFLK